MAAVQDSSAENFVFDDSRIDWQPFAGIDCLQLALCDVDVERQVVDLIVKFEPDKIAALHNHMAQTNMFIIKGELRMYETDGTLKEVRPAGRYYRGRRDDIHSEGGGPEGAVVFYSVRGHGAEQMFEIMDDDQNVTLEVGMAEIKEMWAAQNNQQA